jgi:hypothetical protein
MICFFNMDNIIKFLSSYVLNMVNITILLRNYLKSDVEFLKYIVIFSWHYVLPCALHDDNI